LNFCETSIKEITRKETTKSLEFMFGPLFGFGFMPEKDYRDRG